MERDLQRHGEVHRIAAACCFVEILADIAPGRHDATVARQVPLDQRARRLSGQHFSAASGGQDITEALCGTRVSTVSNLNKKIYAKIEAWRNRRIEGEHPYLYLC